MTTACGFPTETGVNAMPSIAIGSPTTTSPRSCSTSRRRASARRRSIADDDRRSAGTRSRSEPRRGDARPVARELRREPSGFQIAISTVVVRREDLEHAVRVRRGRRRRERRRARLRPARRRRTCYRARARSRIVIATSSAGRSASTRTIPGSVASTCAGRPRSGACGRRAPLGASSRSVVSSSRPRAFPAVLEIGPRCAASASSTTPRPRSSRRCAHRSAVELLRGGRGRRRAWACRVRATRARLVPWGASATLLGELERAHDHVRRSFVGAPPGRRVELRRAGVRRAGIRRRALQCRALGGDGRRHLEVGERRPQVEAGSAGDDGASDARRPGRRSPRVRAPRTRRRTSRLRASGSPRGAVGVRLVRRGSGADGRPAARRPETTSVPSRSARVARPPPCRRRSGRRSRERRSAKWSRPVGHPGPPPAASVSPNSPRVCHESCRECAIWTPSGRDA